MAETIRPNTNAWFVVALLFPVALLNYLDRQMLATMGLSIKADFKELQGANGAENFGRLPCGFPFGERFLVCRMQILELGAERGDLPVECLYDFFCRFVGPVPLDEGVAQSQSGFFVWRLKGVFNNFLNF